MAAWNKTAASKLRKNRTKVNWKTLYANIGQYVRLCKFPVSVGVWSTCDLAKATHQRREKLLARARTEKKLLATQEAEKAAQQEAEERVSEAASGAGHRAGCYSSSAVCKCGAGGQ